MPVELGGIKTYTKEEAVERQKRAEEAGAFLVSARGGGVQAQRERQRYIELHASQNYDRRESVYWMGTDFPPKKVLEMYAQSSALAQFLVNFDLRGAAKQSDILIAASADAGELARVTTQATTGSSNIPLAWTRAWIEATTGDTYAGLSSANDVGGVTESQLYVYSKSDGSSVCDLVSDDVNISPYGAAGTLDITHAVVNITGLATSTPAILAAQQFAFFMG